MFLKEGGDGVKWTSCKIEKINLKERHDRVEVGTLNNTLFIKYRPKFFDAKKSQLLLSSLF